jgi:hypothetical protein
MASKTSFRALGIEFKFGGIEFTREPAGSVQQEESASDAENTSQTGTALTAPSRPSRGRNDIPSWLRWLGPCPYMKLFCIISTLALFSAFAVVMYKK